MDTFAIRIGQFGSQMQMPTRRITSLLVIPRQALWLQLSRRRPGTRDRHAQKRSEMSASQPGFRKLRFSCQVGQVVCGWRRVLRRNPSNAQLGSVPAPNQGQSLPVRARGPRAARRYHTLTCTTRYRTLPPATTRNRASRTISVSSKDQAWGPALIRNMHEIPSLVAGLPITTTRGTRPTPRNNRPPAERHHRNTAPSQPGPVVVTE